MKGRIFPDSTGIHEDQARILFDYYRAAAESIVRQELDFEQKIADTKVDKDAAEKRMKSLAKKSVLFGAVGVVVGALLFFALWWLPILVILAVLVFFGLRIIQGRSKEMKFMADCDTRSAGFAADKTAIRRDYKVHRIGTAYVPVATKVPFQGQSFLMDNTGTLERHRFTLYDIKDKKGLAESAARMDEILSTIPMVDSTEDAEVIDTSTLSSSIQRINLGNWTSTLDRHVRRLNFLFNDLREMSVEVPVIEPNGKLAAFLETHGNDEAPESLKVRVFEVSGIKEALDSFGALADMSKSRSSGEEKNVEDFCRAMMEKAAVTLQLVCDMRGKSLDLVNLYGTHALGVLMKGSFNYYSPELEAESIARVREEKFNFSESADSWEPFALNRSSRVRYDLFSDNWVAEDGSRTSNPYGIHQIFEEIFMPMVSNLMKENRLERLKVYNDIRNQKIDYLNQWHRDTEDFYARNRAEINELSNRIRSITSDYLSDLNTFKALSDTIKGMEAGANAGRVAEIRSEEANITVMLSQAQMYGQFIESFNTRFENFRAQINELAQDFEHIEFFEASLRDGEARDSAQALATTDWDARRRVLLRLGHQIAKNSSLPPAPTIEDKAERDSLINLVSMYENLKSELEHEEVEAVEAERRARSGRDTRGKKEPAAASPDVPAAEGVASSAAEAPAEAAMVEGLQFDARGGDPIINPTAEEIRKTVRGIGSDEDNPFVILSFPDDAFVQCYCTENGEFSVEFKDAGADVSYVSDRTMKTDEVIDVLLLFARGNASWKDAVGWNEYEEDEVE